MSKLDWMYKSSNTVDPEEYLLGRSIDKNYENQSSSHNEVDKDILPTSIFAGGNSNVQVDVFRKKKEDPLEQIKQKEIEMRKQLLKNPVKLKKLQSQLKAKEEKQSHKDKRKKEKKKKKKKSKNKDIDDLLADKYMKLINKYGAKNLIELTKSGDDSEEEDTKVEKKPKRRAPSSSSCSESEESIRRRKSSPRRKDSSKHSDSTKNKSKRRSRSRERDIRDKLQGRKDFRSRSPRKFKDASHKGSPSDARDDFKGRKGSSSSPSSSSEDSSGDHTETADLVKSGAASKRSYGYSSDEDKPTFKKSYGLVLPKGVVPNPASRSSEVKCDKVEASAVKLVNKYTRPKPTKLTEEEKQAKLKEMIEDAQKWERSRKFKVSKYREEQKKEEAQNKKFDGEFMRKELAKATSKSVAERIKSNINNLQRSKFSMDQNFAKRT